jgi:hypothetical protein
MTTEEKVYLKAYCAAIGRTHGVDRCLIRAFADEIAKDAVEKFRLRFGTHVEIAANEARARLEAAEQVIAAVTRWIEARDLWIEARDLCTPMTAREAQDRRYDAGVALSAAHSNYFARYGDKKSDV